VHRQHLPNKAGLDFLTNEPAVSPQSRRAGGIAALLPTFEDKPLPSPELQPVEDTKDTILKVLFTGWPEPINQHLQASH
jgi:hypothetical protein